MEQSESITEIIPAYINARKEIKAASKSAFNKFDKYNYATEQDWHDSVIPSILENELTVFFCVSSVENLPERTSSKGSSMYSVVVHGTATLVHSSGQWIRVRGAGEGMDRADKAVYKAQTGLKKYLYSLLFALPTTDDVEQEDPQQNQSDQQIQNNQPRRTEEEIQREAFERFENYISGWDAGEGFVWSSIEEIKEWIGSRMGSGGYAVVKSIKPLAMKALLDQLKEETESRIKELSKMDEIPIT